LLPIDWCRNIRNDNALVLPANSPTIHCCGQPIRRRRQCHIALGLSIRFETADPAETRYGGAANVKRAADLYAQGPKPAPDRRRTIKAVEAILIDCRTETDQADSRLCRSGSANPRSSLEAWAARTISGSLGCPDQMLTTALSRWSPCSTCSGPIRIAMATRSSGVRRQSKKAARTLPRPRSEPPFGIRVPSARRCASPGWSAERNDQRLPPRPKGWGPVAAAFGSDRAGDPGEEVEHVREPITEVGCVVAVARSSSMRPSRASASLDPGRFTGPLCRRGRLAQTGGVVRLGVTIGQWTREGYVVRR
jgi:hypothetical protein